MKVAFITGITGQDGSYLAEFLLKKNYQVIGLISSKYNIGNQNIKNIESKLILESGDLLDKQSLARIIKKYRPDEIYNLAGITFIPQSWQKPDLTFQVNALGTLKLLELIKDFSPRSRFYQATSAKIFGNPQKGPQNENCLVQPNTPYAVSKASAHFLVQNFRNHFNIFACSGIMYNHESERRGPDFVTRKITIGAVKIKTGRMEKLSLGNLKAKQDWGYAPDYVEAMWLMLQQDIFDDYIVATGETHSVEDICRIAFQHLGVDWRKYVEQKSEFIRKEKAQAFFGDASKARKKLGWCPKTDFETMIEKMVDNDWRLAKKGKL